MEHLTAIGCLRTQELGWRVTLPLGPRSADEGIEFTKPKAISIV